MKSVFISLVLMISFESFARNDLGLNRKQNQERRINSGVETGQLTSNEAAKLRQEQAAIQATRAAYKASGGKISSSEKAVLQNMRDQASKHIYNQKHDGRVVEGSVAHGQKQMNRRIENGSENGSLTDREEEKLENQMDEYRYLRRGLASDEDGITQEDAEILKQRQQEIKKQIFKQKHDKQVDVSQ